MEKFPEASEYLNKAKNLGTNINNLMGLCNFKMKNYYSAIEYFTLALEDNINLKDIINYNLGNVYLLLNNYTKAIQYYEEARKLNFKYANLSIGNCYFLLGEYDKAINYFKNSLNQKDNFKLEKKFIGVLYNSIGNCYCKLKKYDKAGNSFILSAKNGHKQYIQKIANFMFLGKKYDDAINFIMNAHNKGFPIEYFILGYCYFHKNNLPEAKKNFELALKNNSIRAKTELAPYIKFENNEYIVDIDKMNIINSLLTFNTQENLESCNNLSNEKLTSSDSNSSNKKSEKRTASVIDTNEKQKKKYKITIN